MSEEKNIPGKKPEDRSKNIEAGTDNAEHFPDNTHAQQPQPTNVKPETENMEVHKHPHHVTHKKKWKEYILEFAMLRTFLYLMKQISTILYFLLPIR